MCRFNMFAHGSIMDLYVYIIDHMFVIGLEKWAYLVMFRNIFICFSFLSFGQILIMV